MIASLLLLLAAPQAAPPPAAEEILVLGQRLETWRGRVEPSGAALRCVTTRSSGDPEVDQVGCGAMVACVTPLRPRLEAAADRRRPKAERRALQGAAERELTACLTERRDALIADLAERRYQSSSKALDARN